MGHESFEDDEVARVLNEHYVSIKVDREERPDVDHLYMTVCQALTGHGGWPLTIMMTPEQKPFFAGTYFPKKRKYGRAGLLEILEAVRQQWTEEPAKLHEAAQSITDQVTKGMGVSRKGELGEETLRQALEQYKATFDSEYGGFGDAPKFPTAHNLSLLLRLARRYEDREALQMVEKTLEYMYRGGLYDHIGFGFARYSTDEKWLVPHFEKMLYDNALLATSYLEAYMVTNDSSYADIARHIFTYILRDMTSPEGGFYCAEDADSEGIEGNFYVWTPEEVAEVLGEEDGEAFCELYDITRHGNFEGHSIPNLLRRTHEKWADEQGSTVQDVHDWVEVCRQKLFDAREQRVHPGKDDKILTSWNGLMIAALATGFKVLGEPKYVQAAEAAASFIDRHLVDANGKLLARYRDGEAKYRAYLDDCACYMYGLLELYEATFDLRYMKRALSLCEDMIHLFWDEQDCGFYFYAGDSEQLLTRMKELYDGAMPSGNSVAACVLQRLARLTGDERLQRYADEQVQAFAGEVQRYPIGHAMFLQALLYAIGPSREIVIAAGNDHHQTEKLVAAVRKTFLPQTVVSLHPLHEEGDAARALMPVLEGKASLNDEAAVYICENFACHHPVTDVAELEKRLK